LNTEFRVSGFEFSQRGTRSPELGLGLGTNSKLETQENPMPRDVIEIDQAKCDGCGQCVDACHEGAIAMVDGKARLVSDVYCDGLGACLGECPQGAITIVQREAAAFDEAAVQERLRALGRTPMPAAPTPHGHSHGGCPGSQPRQLRPLAPPAAESAPLPCGCPGTMARQLQPTTGRGPRTTDQASAPSRLGQWPVQLRLVNPQAPWLRGADLLVCADCVPFAMNGFHEQLLAGKTLVVACPKLDPRGENAARLEALAALSGARSVTVARMEVPCCAGLMGQTEQAFGAHAPQTPVREVIVGVDGTT
jgi:ferredoxin